MSKPFTHLDDVRRLVLTIAAASAEEPTRATALRAWLRAALVLVGEEAMSSLPPATLSPGAVVAIRELAFSLGRSAEHAEALAEHVGLGE